MMDSEYWMEKAVKALMATLKYGTYAVRTRVISQEGRSYIIALKILSGILGCVNSIIACIRGLLAAWCVGTSGLQGIRTGYGYLKLHIRPALDLI